MKFKLWDKELKAMITSENSDQFLIGLDGRVFDTGFTFSHQARHCESLKVIRPTGLKDKNGVEIYEGDIVKAFTVFGMVYDYTFDNDNDPAHMYQIVFDDGCFQFKNTKQWSDGSNDWRSIENVELFKTEVIGNIHEHSELLDENY